MSVLIRFCNLIQPRLIIFTRLQVKQCPIISDIFGLNRVHCVHKYKTFVVNFEFSCRLRQKRVRLSKIRMIVKRALKVISKLIAIYELRTSAGVRRYGKGYYRQTGLWIEKMSVNVCVVYVCSINLVSLS